MSAKVVRSLAPYNSDGVRKSFEIFVRVLIIRGYVVEGKSQRVTGVKLAELF